MLWPNTAILILFLVFIGVLGMLFLAPLIEAAVNAIILYFLGLRFHTELIKYDRGQHYLIAGILSALFISLVGNFLPLWWITTVALLAFVLVHLYLTLTKR